MNTLNNINKYLCEHYIIDNGEELLFNNYIYAKTFEEAERILKDINKHLHLIKPKIVGKSCEILYDTDDGFLPTISTVDLSPYFLFYQLDYLINNKSINTEILMDLLNKFVELEEYRFAAKLKDKYLT